MRSELSHYLKTVAAAALLVGVNQSIQAQSILQNGGFETGDFTGWNTVNKSEFLSVDDGSSSLFIPYDGSYYALFGGSGDSIDQAVVTTPGAAYDISYSLNASYATSDILVSWDGAPLSSLTSYNSGQVNNGWVNFDFQVTASSALTDLAFTYNNGPAMGIDDVSITSVPEPSTLALAGLGSLALLVLRHRRVC